MFSSPISYFHQSKYYGVEKSFGKRINSPYGEPKFFFGKDSADYWGDEGKGQRSPYTILRKWKEGSTHFISSNMGGIADLELDTWKEDVEWGEPYVDYFYEIKVVEHFKETKTHNPFSKIMVRGWKVELDEDWEDYDTNTQVEYEHGYLNQGDITITCESEWEEQEVFKGSADFEPTLGYNMYMVDEDICEDLMSNSDEVGEGWQVVVGGTNTKTGGWF